MNKGWMLAAAAALTAATTANAWAQRAALPALPAVTSVPVGEIGVGAAPIPLQPAPLHHPRPLPDSKPSSAPVPIPMPLQQPQQHAPSQPPASHPASAPAVANPGVAILGQPVAEACCAQPQMCECPLCLLKRHMTARFRRFLGGCTCCCCGCDPPSLAESVASRVRAEEACAPARLCAVRYLGTVDCHYYPEAEEALIAALRCDRNRCVRQEAACALGSGCCGTPRVIESLTLVVAASEEDGNPCETCDDVRRAAFQSLQKLLTCHASGESMDSVPAGRLSAALARARLTMAQVAGSAWVACAYRCPPPPQRNLAEVIVNAARNRHAACVDADCGCAAPPQRNLAEVIVNAARNRHGASIDTDCGCAPGGCATGSRATGERYFPLRPASQPSQDGGTPGPLPRLLKADHASPAFDLPVRSAHAASTAAAPLASGHQTTEPNAKGSKPEPRIPSPKEKPLAMLGHSPPDADVSADIEEMPVLVPASLSSASALEPAPRSLLPAGLTPLGRIPEELPR